MPSVGSDSASSSAVGVPGTSRAGHSEAGSVHYGGYYPVYRHDPSYSPPLGSGAYIGGSPPAPLSPLAGGFAMMGGQMMGASPPAQYYFMGGSPAGSPQMAPLIGSPVGSATGQFMAMREDSRGGDGSAVDSRNVYIRNLEDSCTDEQLRLMAMPYGEIESSKSIIHEATGKCKGYGFVKYRTEEQALRAIEAFNAQGLNSTLARDSFKAKLKRLQDRNSANVYVSNLPPNMDEEQLVELIKPYAVVSARILRDPLTHQHKGAGFARMADRETALLVIEKLKGLQLPNAPGALIPRIADSQGQKQLKKQANTGPSGRAQDDFRSNTTSPLMWSPVLVYSPTASPPPPPPLMHDDARRIPSPSYAAGRLSPGVFVPYAGYASPAFGASYGPHVPSPPAVYAPLPDQYWQPQADDQAAGDLAGTMQDKLTL